jgi:hypothetical protein
MEDKGKTPNSSIYIETDFPDGQKVANYYPIDVGSGTMVSDSTTAVGITLAEDKKQEFVDAIDYAKTHKPYISEIELSISLEGGLKFKIKREPAKIIRVYKEK